MTRPAAPTATTFPEALRLWASDVVDSLAEDLAALATKASAADVYALQGASDGKVDKATLDAQSILGAIDDDTPLAIPVAASRLIGRKATGDIGALTVAEVLTLLAVYTSAQTDTAISNAIAALVDASPGTLDTLNELAAALADDPNFAATMTTALAGKVAISTLTTDGDLLTRAAGVMARITRAQLAADAAFSATYLGQRWKTGWWYSVAGARTVGVPTINRELAVPLLVPASGTIDRIGINATIAGGAASVCRLGIRQVAADGSPGTLITDFGTVATDTLGVKEITVSQAVTGPAVFLTATPQVDTPATFRLTTSAPPLFVAGGSAALIAAASPPAGWVQTGVTGALGAGFTPSAVAGSDLLPVIYVRAA